MITFPIPTPTCIAGEIPEELTVRHYAFDPTLAPPGKTSLAVTLQTDYALWATLAREPNQYAAEKQRVAETVRAVLTERFGPLLDHLEEVDVATPMTWMRHTGNWRGAFEGWLPTRSAMGRSMRGGLRKTLKGLQRFYMVGQWVVPRGWPASVAPAARALIQTMCKQDARHFVATPQSAQTTHAPTAAAA